MAEEQPEGDARIDADDQGGTNGTGGQARRSDAGRKACGAAPAEVCRDIDFSVPTLRHFASYSRVTQFAEGYIVAALREQRALDHMLVHGRPGSGTTTLARAIVRDYAPDRVEEIDAQLGVPMARLAAALRKINRRGVLLVRHVELLDPPCAHLLAGYLEGKRLARRTGAEGGPASMPPWATEIDRAISRSAREVQEGDEQPDRDAMIPGGTVIGTALLPHRLSYRLRNAFKQQIHLRSDPKALRVALVRVLRRAGVELDPSCGPRVERTLASLADATEPMARTIIARAGLERRDRIDDELMRSIIEEDLPARLADTQYAASLRDHLAGRRIREASDEEIDRIDRETGWGRVASRAAIAALIREREARKRQEVVTLPI